MAVSILYHALLIFRLIQNSFSKKLSLFIFRHLNPVKCKIMIAKLMTNININQYLFFYFYLTISQLRTGTKMVDSKYIF